MRHKFRLYQYISEEFWSSVLFIHIYIDNARHDLGKALKKKVDRSRHRKNMHRYREEVRV